MKISVIIPTYNRNEMVERCVKSVVEALGALGDRPLPGEVIVVDDCSPVPVKLDLPGVKVIRNAKNCFQAVSRNNGAKVAKGEYLLILDDDNIVDKNIFKELLAAFERHPRAALIAPMAVHQRPGSENLIWTLGSDFSHWTSQPKDYCPNLPLSKLPPEPIDNPTTYSPNAFMVKREAWDKVGGMDESFVQIYEESDFGWRLIEAGYEAYIATRARTDHYGYLEKGCVSELRQLGIERPARTYYFARNRLRFSRRHFAWYQALLVALVFAPLSAAYYMKVALANRRPDIAWSYLKGTIVGIFSLK